MDSRDYQLLKHLAVKVQSRYYDHIALLSKEDAEFLKGQGFTLKSYPGVGHEYNTNTDAYIVTK